jgi:tetratricopeptide (TPR) repeat protein
MTLDSLKDPANEVNQEGEAVARGYYNLGNVIYQQQGDLVRAETLARESLRIRDKLYSNDHLYLGISIYLLSAIFRSQGKLGDEVQKLMARSLAIYVKHEGVDGINTAIMNNMLGQLHCQRSRKDFNTDMRFEHLRLSKSHYKESLRIVTKVYGPAHKDTIEAASKLSMIESLERI